MANEDKKSGARIEDAIKAVASHNMAEHQYGQYFYHEHEEEADHEHDEFQYDGPLEENPLWIQDNVHLTSVGIDIGSSTSHLLFARVILQRCQPAPTLQVTTDFWH
jgi:ethanolamine utilization protein EutA